MIHTNLPDYILQVKCVTKTYGDLTAVHVNSIDIAYGEKVAILGSSGSGKTTLLNMIGAVTAPSEGSILLEGTPISELQPGRTLSQLVGFIHQRFDLVQNLNVVNNVLAGKLGQWNLLKSIISLVTPREVEIAIKALDRVVLPNKLRVRVSKLSGGEQQRVAIARLLVQDPKLIIADEPVSSLDPTRARNIINLLSDISSESSKTLIASIHSVELAKQYFNRIIGLKKGEVQFDVPTNLFTDAMLDDLYNLSPDILNEPL